MLLMEAISMEIPCIATCINGIPELIRDGSEGLLVPPSDAGALAAAIARLRDNAALRDSLGKAGRGRIRKAYNLDNSAGVLWRRLGTARPLHPRLSQILPRINKF